jgi:uncharacterized membrane protein YgcG
MQPSARRPSSAFRARRGERGVSIVLAMLVLFVILVVVVQVNYDAHVEMDQAWTTVDTTRMHMMADAATQQAESSLLMDIENAQQAASGDAAGGSSAGMLDPGGGSKGNDANGAGSDKGDGSTGAAGTGSDVSDVIARTDSKLDDWQDSVSLQPPIGNDYTLWVEVEDEDSKINLLGLWSTDTNQREPLREIIRNLLDHAFEGTSLDLSFTDATEILDKLDDWVKGNRGSFDPIPKPLLKKSNAEDQAAAGSMNATATSASTDTPAVLDDGEHDFPLTLHEMLMVEGLKPEQMSGFVEDDVFHPGLEQYLTVWSNLEVKPAPPATDDPFSGSPFTQGSLFDKPPPDAAGGTGSSKGSGGSGGSSGAGGTGDTGGAGSDAGNGDTTASDTLPTNNGLVNINTCSMAVLRAIAPDDIPTSFLERIVEYRDNILRLRQAGKIGGPKSLFDDPTGSSSSKSSSSSSKSSPSSSSSSSSDDQSGAGAGSDAEQDDDDPTKYVFEKPEDVIPKVEQEYGITLKVDPEVESTFVGRLAVTSEVFTIKVLVRDAKTGRRTSWRSVVWRQQAGEKTVMIPLVELEPYYDARRLKDFPQDMAEQSGDRFQRWTDQGYKAP